MTRLSWHWFFLMVTNPVFTAYIIVQKWWDVLQGAVLWVGCKTVPLRWILEDKLPVKVYSVLYRRKIDQVAPARSHNFISLFCGARNMDYLLLQNVTLYCLEGNNLYFVETEPGLNPYSSDIAPFLYHSQFKHAKKLSVVGVDEFLKFAERINRQDLKILLLSHTGRCGSTLLAQMLERTGKVLTISEPDIFNSLRKIQEGACLTRQHGQILEAAIQLYARSALRWGTFHILCLKTRSPSQSLVPFVQEHLPNIRHLYVYRRGVKTVSSCCKVFRLVPAWRHMSQSPRGYYLFTRLFGLKIKGPIYRVTDLFSFVTLTWASSIAEYKRFVDAGIPIRCLRYEELLADPLSHLDAMSEHFGFDFTSADKAAAIEALGKNALRGIGLYHGTGQRRQVRVRADCEDICRLLGVPSIYSDEKLLCALMDSLPCTHQDWSLS